MKQALLLCILLASLSSCIITREYYVRNKSDVPVAIKLVTAEPIDTLERYPKDQLRQYKLWDSPRGFFRLGRSRKYTFHYGRFTALDTIAFTIPPRSTAMVAKERLFRPKKKDKDYQSIQIAGPANKVNYELNGQMAGWKHRQQGFLSPSDAFVYMLVINNKNSLVKAADQP